MAGTPGNRTQETYNDNCIYGIACPYRDQSNIEKQVSSPFEFTPLPFFYKEMENKKTHEVGLDVEAIYLSNQIHSPYNQ